FLQAAESLRVDRRIVHEHVGAAVLGSDEAESLGVVEPLHGAVLHIAADLVLDGMRAWRVGQPAHGPSMQSHGAACNHPASRGWTIRDTQSVAAATLDSTSSREIDSSGSGPAPAAQFE